MSGYTPLFSSIIMSTIWREDDKTRLVWITMLALADQNGNVEASIPGLADAARVSIEECQTALKKLSSPDPFSRSQEAEGRRIVAIEGGWHLVNHAKYAKKAKSRAEYFRQYRQKLKSQAQQLRNTSQHGATLRNRVQQGATDRNPSTITRTTTATTTTTVDVPESMSVPGDEHKGVRTPPTPPTKKGGARPRKQRIEDIPIPPEIDTPEFRKVWADWIQHRKEIRHPLTPLAVKRQFNRLIEWGVDRAISAIEHSIAQDYRGIFEATDNGRRTSLQRRLSGQDDEARKPDYVPPKIYTAAMDDKLADAEWLLKPDLLFVVGLPLWASEAICRPRSEVLRNNLLRLTIREARLLHDEDAQVLDRKLRAKELTKLRENIRSRAFKKRHKFVIGTHQSADDKEGLCRDPR